MLLIHGLTFSCELPPFGRGVLVHPSLFWEQVPRLFPAFRRCKKLNWNLWAWYTWDAFQLPHFRGIISRSLQELPLSGFQPPCLVLASACGDNIALYNSLNNINKLSESITGECEEADGFHPLPVTTLRGRGLPALKLKGAFLFVE